jgi:hypothetical protein
MIQTIPRDRFVEHVMSAVYESDLSDAEAAAVVAAAKDPHYTLVSIGDFQVGEHCCPLTQARLMHPLPTIEGESEEDRIARRERLSTFYREFDNLFSWCMDRVEVVG